MGLAERFLAALDPSLGPPPPGVHVDGELARLVARARDRWAAIGLDTELFAEAVGHAVEAWPRSREDWDRIRAADLWLATACGHGDRVAVQAFRAEFGTDIAVCLQKLGSRGPPRDDAEQLVWQKLLVVGEDRSPRVLEYRGKGQLRNWVKVVVSRFVMDLHKRRGHEGPALSAGVVVQRDPELDFLKRRYGQAFERALGDAIASLTVRQRNLLSQTLLDHLDTPQLASLYGVHRTTVGRWLSEARAALVQRARAALTARLGITAEEVDSIIRLIDTSFDVTFGHLLRPP